MSAGFHLCPAARPSGQGRRSGAASARHDDAGASGTQSIREDVMRKSKRVGRTPSSDHVAGNGLIDRRALLGRGIAFAGAVGAGAAGVATAAAAEPLTDEPWSLKFGEITPALQTPSPFEKGVTRALSN